MMVKTASATPFIVPQPEFLLQFVVNVLLSTPAHLCDFDELFDRNVRG